MPPTLGPGSYHAEEAFKKLTTSPCQVKVHLLAHQTVESGHGKTYYIDGGQIIKDPHAEKIYGKPLSPPQSHREP
jgi:hypothetical protein